MQNECKYCINEECLNVDCPYCCCPITEFPEVCKYYEKKE